MAQSPIIHALAAKRSELSGALLELERQAKKIRADLVHVDAALRMFDPSIQPHAIKPKGHAPIRLRYFAPGEMSRTVRDMMRERASETISVDQIATRVVTVKGLDASDQKLRLQLVRRFLWVLHVMQRRGEVLKVGHGVAARWALAIETEGE